MTGVVVLWVVGALVLAAVALAVAVAWRVAHRFLVPRAYGLMPEFTVLDVRPVPPVGSGDPPGDPPGDHPPGHPPGEHPPGEHPPGGSPRDESPRDPPGHPPGDAAATDLEVVLPAPPPDPPQHADTRLRGAFGLVWEGGHGVLGDVLADAGGRVVRSLTMVAGVAPRPGVPARMDAFYYRRDPARDHGIAFQDLRLDGPAGKLAAWYVPPDPGERAVAGTAVLALHGRRRGERSETLRALPAFHEVGAPVLALSYRNHDASDASPDGFYHYGTSEWQDAIVGARALAERGAKRIVVFGISMGGAVALEAAKCWPSDLPPLVGLILDSPLVDPEAAVRTAARRARLPFPAAFARAVMLVARWRAGIDLAALRQVDGVARWHAPVLLIAGTHDTTVPIETIDAFAAALHAPLAYRRLDGVQHVEAWNHDPVRYGAWLRAFVQEVSDGTGGQTATSVGASVGDAAGAGDALASDDTADAGDTIRWAPD